MNEGVQKGNYLNTNKIKQFIDDWGGSKFSF